MRALAFELLAVAFVAVFFAAFVFISDLPYFRGNLPAESKYRFLIRNRHY
jgi:hypothetical protein